MHWAHPCRLQSTNRNQAKTAARVLVQECTVRVSNFPSTSFTPQSQPYPFYSIICLQVCLLHSTVSSLRSRTTSVFSLIPSSPHSARGSLSERREERKGPHSGGTQCAHPSLLLTQFQFSRSPSSQKVLILYLCKGFGFILNSNIL